MEVEILFELIIVVVPIEPAMFEIRVFAFDESVFARVIVPTFRLEILALVRVAFPEKISVLERVALERFVVPVAFKLLVFKLASCKVFPVALLKTREEISADRILAILANRLEENKSLVVIF